MNAEAYTAEGAEAGEPVELPEEPFDGTINRDVLHQVVTALQARARQGTASTKNRATITGGGKKPWRQKGTGRARHGSIRSPIWAGGAVTFGPHPRDYQPRIPKQMNRLAIKSALNARAREGRLVVVDPLELEEPRTKAVAGLLDELGFDDENVLLLTAGLDRVVHLSGRNIPDLEVRPWGNASAYDILWAGRVIVERGAWEAEQEEPAADAAAGDADEEEHEEEPEEGR